MRVLTNQDFTYVRQDIEQYKKSQAERTATLNEHDAIKEREQDALKSRARDEERQTRPDPGIKIYELTVKNSTEPGLPPPENWVGQTNQVKELGNFTGTGLLPAQEMQALTNGVPNGGKKISPPFDPMLDESEHILEDYITLLQKSGSLTVNP